MIYIKEVNYCTNKLPVILVIYFESDSKVCVDSLSGASAPHWRIAGLVSDLILTVASHPHWSFVWTKREANCATHVLAGWSQRCWLWGLFGVDSGPSCFLLACSEDLKWDPCCFSCSFCSLNDSFLLSKKKKKITSISGW